MFKRSFSGLLAGVCVLANAAVIPVGTVSAEGTAYSMKVNVKLDGTKKEISPYIYGVNAFDAGNVKNVTVNNIRQGGNRYTGYNWETNWSNAGEDWHHSSDTNIGDITDGAGAAVRKLSGFGEKYNIPYKLATLQMAGYVSADKNGTVTEAEKAPSKRWNKVEFKKDGELSLEPDLTDGVVYMDEYVNYIVKTLGDSTTDKGIQGYSLDNEPVLWNDTHPLMHPDEVSNSELISKSIELAKVVKDIDPKAEIFGPAFWGILPCAQAGEGEKYQDPDWQKVKNDYTSYLGYYLDQMAKAEKENGKRLLDVIDIHYYAQDCSTDDSRLQAARSLYDPSYVENSWLQPSWGKYFPVLPWLKNTVDQYYPGTKIAMSEYNVADIGNEKNVGKTSVSAIAEAEALGAFAMNDVYFATYWGTLPEAPYVESAINLYTNYDGKGASFGDTLVEASTEDLSKSAAFASINGSDDSQVTVVLSNKNKTDSEKAEITLSGSSSDYKSAVVYAIEQDHSDIRIIDVQNDLSGNKLTVELPPLSVAQVVLSDKATDKTVYVAPDIEVKEETFNFSELSKNANGNYVIPISDKDALKKAVIRYSASCSSGAGWYGGGGGLCFNKMILADGSSVWGNKAYTYGIGATETEVVFDGTFTVMTGPDTSDEKEAKIGDDSIEFQDWWKSSTNSESGDDVTVTYNSITLVYEYDHTGEQHEDDRVWGDADCDGEVKMNDAVLVMQSLSNPDRFGEDGTEEKHLTSEGKANADVSKEGEGLSPKDALAIQKYLLKIIPSLPEK
ncbi:MAG TPA: glycoside hydrolase family 44 protein [Ruminococcus sp.]|nr:glycoside hydrolase family 44 protein [Ruminococcus sp.]